jgi:hypothetical protein
MSHLDSPLEKKYAAERTRMGLEQSKRAAAIGSRGMDGWNAKTDGYFAEGKGFKDGFVKVDRGRVVAGDRDGDGKVSMSERLDADGDGKVSAAEYASGMDRMSRSGGSFAALSVGVSATERASWTRFREDRAQGRYVANVAERVRAHADNMVFNPLRGGWTPAAQGRWQGVSRGDYTNRNLKAGRYGEAAVQIRRGR